MSELELEIDELGLIYGNNFVNMGDNVYQISVTAKGRHAQITFKLPENYPNAIPEMEADIGGCISDECKKHLDAQAKTMQGMCMLSYLAGEAMDYLAGWADREFGEQQEHITQTPFSRERFFLWLDKFNKEMEANRNAIKKPMTGREMFEKGLAKARSE